MPNEIRPHNTDDIAFWPDGTWATLGEVWAGGFTFMSDDFEIVRWDDDARLTALGLAEELGIQPG